MQVPDLKLGVIGLGYVGLTSAAGFAEMGFSVLGTDSDERKLVSLAEGRSYISEPGLQGLLDTHIRDERLRFTSDLSAVVREARILFICVGTPQATNGEPDLSHVDSVARDIANQLTAHRVIVTKSTVPPGTAARIKSTMLAHVNGAADFDMVSNPEFLREGSAVEDFLRPDRIVVGVETPGAADLIQQVYAPFDSPVVVTDLSTAEIIKHASNAFLATRISFINMVSDLCEATGADVTQVAAAMGMDPRIGPRYLDAGLGYGGSCLPKDIRAFLHTFRDMGLDASLLDGVEQVNGARVDRLIEKVTRALGATGGKTIGVLGLSFKPCTEDTRESPSLRVVRRLRHSGARLRLHDPEAMEPARRELPETLGVVEYCESPYDAARGADALLILTPWTHYLSMDMARLRDLMASPVVVDACNALSPSEMRAQGFRYVSCGRP